MSGNQFIRSVQVVVALTVVAVADSAVADDKKPPAKPTIEFRDFPDKPMKYKFSLVVKLEGTPHTFESRDNSGDGGTKGDGLAEFLGSEMEMAAGWKYEVDGRRLVIEGWKDPKTGTFYSVNKIQFECPSLPKESQPVVKMPPKA